MNPERLILSCILNDQSVHDVVIPELKPEYFTSDRELLGRVLEMYRKGKPIDTYTLIAECPKQLSDITTIQNLVSHAGNVMAYVARLKDNYLRGQMKRYFDVDIGQDDPYEYLAGKLAQLSALQESITPHVHRTLGDIITESLDRIYQAKNNPGASFGVPTPLTELNTLTNGWQNSDLIILAGRPSRGKTAFALANVRSACEAGKSVAVFSLEMKDTQLMDRLIWSHGMNPEEAGGLISRWNLDIFDKGGVDLEYVIGNCRLIKRLRGLDFIVIDYLGLMKLPRAEKRSYQIGELTRSLKAFAKEIDRPIMLLCQLNRDIENRGSHKHQLSDLRESGDIEQDADLVVFISRPIMDGSTEDKDKNPVDNLTVIQVEKHRNGKAPVTIKARNNERVNYYTDWTTTDLGDNKPF